MNIIGCFEQRIIVLQGFIYITNIKCPVRIYRIILKKNIVLSFQQEACLQGNLIAICLEQLNDPHPLLRQWVAICLGRIWQHFDSARWCGVRDSAHEKLYSLLSDPIPEVLNVG